MPRLWPLKKKRKKERKKCSVLCYSSTLERYVSHPLGARGGTSVSSSAPAWTGVPVTLNWEVGGGRQQAVVQMPQTSTLFFWGGGSFLGLHPGHMEVPRPGV